MTFTEFCEQERATWVELQDATEEAEAMVWERVELAYRHPLWMGYASSTWRCVTRGSSGHTSPMGGTGVGGSLQNLGIKLHLSDRRGARNRTRRGHRDPIYTSQLGIPPGILIGGDRKSVV